MKCQAYSWSLGEMLCLKVKLLPQISSHINEIRVKHNGTKL